MPYSVSLEEVEGRWVAYVPSLPGCFAGEETLPAAQAALPAALHAYRAWRQAHGNVVTLEPDPTFAVDEIAREWPDPAHPDYVVSAFFAADAPPLTAADIALAVRLLDWTYADLLAAGDVPPAALAQPVENGWSIQRILKHCSHAEWWYLDRLGLAPSPALEPSAWQERLAMAHERLLAVLPQLEGVARIELKDAELWSPRKMLRRALWHERDHTHHIYTFRARLGV